MVQYVTGVDGHMSTFQFRSKEEFADWGLDISSLKSTVAQINDTFERSAGSARDSEARDASYRKWMEEVTAFRTKWGDQRYPADIKEAFEDISSHVPTL